MSAKKVNKTTLEIFIYVFLLLVLLLTSININIFLQPKQTKVLGAETQNNEEIFWQDFLSKHPDYIPGWIEMGKADKANEIDPNYIKP
jgi:regulatory protein YycI of two-component signal transduction system YycFG